MLHSPGRPGRPRKVAFSTFRSPITSPRGKSSRPSTSVLPSGVCTEGYDWQCWQCLSAFISNVDLEKHLKVCASRNAVEIIEPSREALPGCPFCKKDGASADKKPYYLSDFDAHVAAHHSDVESLKCPYCTLDMDSPNLIELTSHILLEHQFHWRPCPASLVYQRRGLEDVPHRALTCLGCGWCSVVLRARDAASPSTSLAQHLERCRGASLAPLPRLPARLVTLRRPLTAKGPLASLLASSQAAEQVFAARFPCVRGYARRETTAAAVKPAPLLSSLGPPTPPLPLVVVKRPRSEEGDAEDQKEVEKPPAPKRRPGRPKKKVGMVMSEEEEEEEEEELENEEEAGQKHHLLTNGQEEKVDEKEEEKPSPVASESNSPLPAGGKKKLARIELPTADNADELTIVERTIAVTVENPPTNTTTITATDTAEKENDSDQQQQQPVEQPAPLPPSPPALTPSNRGGRGGSTRGRKPRGAGGGILTSLMTTMRTTTTTNPANVFDVPLDLPPSPPPQQMTGTGGEEGAKNNKVYVCPICGKNELNSLRERDKHLVEQHNGELVFPCQLCGMAYPVYIALRRHALLKHPGKFERVLYGQPEQAAIDCPYCELVAFTSPTVLNRHLAHHHPAQYEQRSWSSQVANVLASGDDEDREKIDHRETEEEEEGMGGEGRGTAGGGGEGLESSFEDDGALGMLDDDVDWTVERSARRGAIATFTGARRSRGGRGRGRRGRPRSVGASVYSGSASGAPSASLLLTDPDYLESVEDPLHRPTPRGRGRGRGRGSSTPRGTGRPRGRPRGSRSQPLNLLAGVLTQRFTQQQQQQLQNQPDQVVAGGSGQSTSAPPNVISQMEEVVLSTPGEHAPVSCDQCGEQEGQTVFDNQRELYIHMELDHNSSESTCEQLGCQGCGRIFFGPYHRNDLIGHIRALHQGHSLDLLSCLNPDCSARFTSPRLRTAHSTASNPAWACPLDLTAESIQAVAEVGESGASAVPDTTVLATEMAADAAGQAILAYGCPVCSRVFTGQNCTARYLAHRGQCVPEAE